MSLRSNPPTQEQIDAVIEGAGSVTTSHTMRPRKEKTLLVQLRIGQGLLGRIDRILKHKPKHIPRHTWLLEALAEKVERETPGQG